MNKLPALFVGTPTPPPAPIPDGVIVFWFKCPDTGRPKQLGVTLAYFDALTGERSAVPFGGLVFWSAILTKAARV